jgi:hypothetical protein
MTGELDQRELELETAEALPERSVLALVNINALLAANVGAALNVGTVNSVAYAEAVQTIVVIQS